MTRRRAVLLLIAVCAGAGASACASDEAANGGPPVSDDASSAERQVESAVEGWADALRARDAQAVCRLAFLGERAARQTPGECRRDLRRSQEFETSPRFEVTRVEVRGGEAAAQVEITEEGDAGSQQAVIPAVRERNGWKVVVSSR